jgi:hypothetical protein
VSGASPLCRSEVTAPLDVLPGPLPRVSLPAGNLLLVEKETEMENELEAKDQALALAEEDAPGMAESGSDDYEDADTPVEDGEDVAGEDGDD